MVGAEDGASSGLKIQSVHKSFADVVALDNVDLHIEPGEVLALTGPSGAGKSTLCRVVAGLEPADSGQLELRGRDLNLIPARDRAIALMFESYALYPHLRVLENVMSPLLARNHGKRSRLDTDSSGHKSDDRNCALEALEFLEIGHLLERYPSELSGGQKQRVALARILVQQNASITMLDEPISHLDAKLRNRLRFLIKQRLVAREAPSLWVTPDGIEALSIGDRVAVIHDGKILQVDTPQAIWRKPANVIVAGLIGDPPISLFPGEVSSVGRGSFFVSPGGTKIELSEAGAAALQRKCAKRKAILGLRPSELQLTPAAEDCVHPPEIYAIEPFGKHTIVTLEIGDTRAQLKTRENVSWQIGDHVELKSIDDDPIVFDANHGHLLDDCSPLSAPIL